MISLIFKARKALLLVAGISMLGAVSVTQAAVKSERSGKAVYEAVCSECHATGKHGAPKFGDAIAWARRADKGMEYLAHHAIEGHRNMPAHGGQAGLTDLEVSRAVSFMVSRGYSRDPDKPYSSPKTLSGEQVVQSRCQECHTDGKMGAPRMGDFSAWEPRLKKGISTLLDSAIKGHGSMPSRGGMGSLSDAEMRSAVVFMVNTLARKPASK